MARWGEQRTAVLATVTVVAMILAGCGDDGGAAATTTTPTTEATVAPTSAPPTTTTAPPDPTTIPEVIDEPYVQAVLDELYALEGEALRYLVEAGEMNETTVGLLSATYEGERLTRALNGFDDLVLSGFDGLLIPPGDVLSDVLEVVTASDGCVFSLVRQDFSGIAEEPLDPPLAGIMLVPATDEHRSAGNTTPWVIASDFFREDGSAPEDLCDG